jgi:hypothetical protein
MSGFFLVVLEEPFEMVFLTSFQKRRLLFAIAFVSEPKTALENADDIPWPLCDESCGYEVRMYMTGMATNQNAT